MTALYLSVVLTVAGSVLSTAVADFQRECSDGPGTERISGIVYYQGPEKVLVQVQRPVNQIMVVTGNRLIIYYPDDNRAFRITSRGPVSLPFAQIFTSIAKEDYGLSDLGYVLANSEFRGDTLFTYWHPPVRAKNLLGESVLGEVYEKLVYVETRGPKGQLMSRSRLSEHLDLQGLYFPGEVLTEVHADFGISTERTVYENVELNVDLPEWVTGFSIPDSADVKEIEW